MAAEIISAILRGRHVSVALARRKALPQRTFYQEQQHCLNVCNLHPIGHHSAFTFDLLTISSANLDRIQQRGFSTAIAILPMLTDEGASSSRPRRKPRVSSATVLWLRENFAVAARSAIPCRAVYDRYLLHCEHARAKPLNESHFGRLLSYLFHADGLRRRRLGFGTSRKPYYENLKLCCPNEGSEGKGEGSSMLLSPTIAWVHENFEICRDVATPCRAVFKQYLSYCEEQKLPPLNDSHFGRLLHSLFRAEGMRWRQMTVGGKRRTYYAGLKPKTYKALEAVTVDDACSHISLATKPISMTVKWLRETFAVQPGYAVPCRSLHKMYVRHCEAFDVRPLTGAHFGRLLRSLFGADNIKWRQIEVGCKATSYYEGLKRLGTSESIAEFADDSVAIDLAHKPTQLTTRWLQSTFELESGYAIPCRVLYQSYLAHCTDGGIKSLSDAHFGRMLRTFFGSSRVKWLQLGFRHNCKSYYFGLKFKTDTLKQAEGMYESQVCPNRWAELSKPFRPLSEHELPSSISASLDKLCQAAEEYEELRKAYLRSTHGQSSVLSIAYNAKTFDVEYSVDRRVPGYIIVGLKSLCKLLASERGYYYAYRNIFVNWRDSLISEERDKCFIGKDCSPRDPNINDSLTSYGVRQLLGFCVRTLRPAVASAAMKAFAEIGLLNPLERLPITIIAEVWTLAQITSRIQSRYPWLVFERNVGLRVKNGYMKKRVMDCWCPLLKLDIECNERDHRHSGVAYNGTYTAEREADIRSVKGSSTSFHYYNPHDPAFSVSLEAEKLCQLITEKLTPLQNSVSSSVAQTNQPLEGQITAVSEANGNLSEQLCATACSLKDLSSQLYCVKWLLLQFRAQRDALLLASPENKVMGVGVQLNGKVFVVSYCIDASVDGLLVIHRDSLCSAISSSHRSGKHTFWSWQKGLNITNRNKFFAPPLKGTRRRSGSPAMESESLTLEGVRSLLHFYEASLPENISVIRHTLSLNGFMLPFNADF